MTSDIETFHSIESTHLSVKTDGLREIGGLLRSVLTRSRSVQVLMVSDRRVAGLYGGVVIESLVRAGFAPCEHLIEPSEGSKSLQTAEEIYATLASHHIGRDGVIIGLGGGVVTDLAGFVAGTWMRGIRSALCPTTTEACIDASIGGKTAVNLKAGKNLVGVFHQPVLVAADPKCLDTLDSRDFSSGLAESVKHALLADAGFVSWQEEQADAILERRPSQVSELVLTNMRIKTDIVKQDPLERTGKRMVLNLGHTIGHAIESLSRCELRHGECVALGLVAALRLSQVEVGLDAGVVARGEKLLERFGLPIQLREAISSDDIIEALRVDKKNRQGQVQFVLLEDIGKPAVRGDVPEPAVREAYESLLP